MAGNSTGLLLVQSAMEKLFGADKVLRRIHPKECVAMGAALLAAALGQDKTVCVACGHLNDADAGQCAECREPLETAVRPAAKVTAATSETGEAGQVAATSEGAEPGGDTPTKSPRWACRSPTAPRGVGDTMTVFVEKNDPYPTAAPRVHVFKTQTPNARIIAIPIYGGDDHEHAGANERQGDAFAILPPGLPARTPVRVSIWLDADGTFKLSAHLQGGQDLKPWVTKKGEEQERAVAELEEAERILGEKSEGAVPRELQQIERQREQVFEHMRVGHFDLALEAVRGVGRAVEVLGKVDESELLRKKAQQLVGFTSGLLQQYRGPSTSGDARSCCASRTRRWRRCGPTTTRCWRPRSASLTARPTTCPRSCR